MLARTIPKAATCVKYIIALLVFAALPAWAGEIAGHARAIDGDTIELAGQRIRLFGIDAPERSQTCEGASGRYECGRDAGATLAALLRGQNVICEVRDRDRYGRIVAVCRTKVREINATMVRSGWAVDYRRYSGGAYQGAQNAAQAERLGMWSGRFEMPEEFRRRVRR